MDIFVCDKLNCEVCDFNADTESELSIHMTEVHAPYTKFNCEQCEVEFDSEVLLNKHIEDNHEVFKCSMCDTETATNELLENHMEVHSKLVDEIIGSMEKHLQSKCDNIEEKLELERLAKDKLKEENSKLETNLKMMKMELEKAKAKRSQLEEDLIKKDDELNESKNMVKNEITKNEKKQHKIEQLEDEVRKKDEEIASMDGNSDQRENVKKVKDLEDDLDLAKELCSEYEETIGNIRKEKEEAVNEVLKSKLKLEEEFRSVTLEKQRLKDTERILLKTFDTIKEYYESKNRKEEEKRSTIKFPCDQCEFESNTRENLKSHIEIVHVSLNRQENTNARNRQQNETNRDQRSYHENVRQSDLPCSRNSRSRNMFYSLEERKKNGYCIYWNGGLCKYEELCKYSHVESPNCYFQENCRRKLNGCKFFHRDMMHDASFLGQQRFQHNRV